MSGVDDQLVRTVDGQDFPSPQAHKLCKRSKLHLSAISHTELTQRLSPHGNSVLCRLRWLALALVCERLAVLAGSKTWPRPYHPEV